MVTEAELQVWVANQIEQGTFSSAIRGATNVQKQIQATEAENYLPPFAIDYLARIRALRGASRILEVIPNLCVVSKLRGISLTIQERLFPDLVTASVNDGMFVIFELKNSRASARETVTELSAYHQELRNHLPFLAFSEVGSVVIASEFSQLLDHALLGQMMWERKQILCLRFVPAQGTCSAYLEVHLPRSWQAVGQLELPGAILTTVTLCFYPSQGTVKEVSGERFAAEMANAVDLIAQQGQAEGTHGFSMLIHDTWHIADIPWQIVIGLLNPYELFKHAVSADFIDSKDSPIAEFLSRDNNAEFMGQGSPNLRNITRRVLRLLERVADPMFEGFTSWCQTRDGCRVRGIPSNVRFWGAVGDYANDLWCRSAFREVFYPELDRHGMSLGNPVVSIPIIDRLNLLPVMNSRGIGCVEALGLGRKIGYLIAIARAAHLTPRDGAAGSLLASLIWAQLDVIPEVLELRELYRLDSRRIPPPPSVRMCFSSIEEAESTEKAATDLARWIIDHMIGAANPIHRLLFGVGLNYFYLWDEYAKAALSSDELISLENGVVEKKSLTHRIFIG